MRRAETIGRTALALALFLAVVPPDAHGQQDVAKKAGDFLKKPLPARIKALDSITDQMLLAEIVKKDRFQETQEKALAKLTDQKLIADIARARYEGDGQTFRSWDVRPKAADRVADQVLLRDLATSASSSDVRAVAARRITDQNALGQIATSDADATVRKVAVGQLNDQSTLLRIAQTDSEPIVQIAAAAKVVDASTLAGGVRNAGVAYEGKPLAAWIEELASSKSTTVRTADGRSVDSQRAAMEALGRGGKPAVDLLRLLLKSENWLVRNRAASALGFAGAAAEDAVPELAAALNDKMGTVVTGEVAAALGQIGPAARPAVATLIDMLRERKGGPKVAKALGQIGSEAAVPVLIDALKYQDTDYCLFAVEALGNIGPAAKDAIPALRDVASGAPTLSGTVDVRSGTLDVRSFVGVLRNEDVRIAAREALKKIEK